MKTVGLRELKNRLSEYVRLVRRGQTVVVTDRGQVVAELRPPEMLAPEGRIEAAVSELVNRGLLTLGGANTSGLYPSMAPLLRRRTSSDLLGEERGRR